MDITSLIQLAVAVEACPVEETYNDFMSAVVELPIPATELERDLLDALVDITTMEYLGTCNCQCEHEAADVWNRRSGHYLIRAVYHCVCNTETTYLNQISIKRMQVFAISLRGCIIRSN